MSISSKKKPIYFASIEDAKSLAKSKLELIWALVGRYAGVFKVYPGGRVIWRR